MVGYADELRLGKPDEDLLRRVAELSGGEYRPTIEQVFDPGERLARQVLPLWPFLLLASLVLFVLDVALKRIVFGG